MSRGEGASRDRPVVLVAGASEELLPGLQKAEEFVELRLMPNPEALAAEIPEAEGLFLWEGDREELMAVWPAAERLRWIQLPTAGIDWVWFPELAQGQAMVTNARGIFDDAIGEWVVGAMLAFVTGLQRSILDQRDRRWDHSRGRGMLAGSRLVVVGPGPIGRACARRAAMLGMRVDLVGRTSRVDPEFGTIRAIEDLHAAVAGAEFVLDALPLTPATRGVFDATAFEAMEPSTIFLNVGRGHTVDEPALIDALTAGRIAGAALDVFSEEPLPPESPLWGMGQVVVSPHLSGDADGWQEAVVELFVGNCRRWVRGERLRGLVDLEAGYGAAEEEGA